MGGGSSATLASRMMCETGLSGGHGGRSDESIRSACRCVMSPAARTTRYDVRRKKMNSLRVSQIEHDQ